MKGELRRWGRRQLASGEVVRSVWSEKTRWLPGKKVEYEYGRRVEGAEGNEETAEGGTEGKDGSRSARFVFVRPSHPFPARTAADSRLELTLPDVANGRVDHVAEVGSFWSVAVQGERQPRLLALVDIFTTHRSYGCRVLFDRAARTKRTFLSVEALRCSATLTLTEPGADGVHWIDASFKCGRNKTRYMVVDYSERVGGGQEAEVAT